MGDSLVELLLLARVFGPFALLNNFHKVPRSFGFISTCAPLRVTSEVPLINALFINWNLSESNKMLKLFTTNFLHFFMIQFFSCKKCLITAQFSTDHNSH